jgi:uncharacterized protein YbaP (TraB family)
MYTADVLIAMDSKELDILRTKLTKFGFPSSMVERLNPWQLASALNSHLR